MALSLFEDRFYHKLCDLLVALRGLGMPRLSVVDGLVGRDGTAFNEGANYPLGWALAGVNEVHVDAVATYLMGLDPQATPYLQFAHARGLGTIDPEGIEVVDLASGTALNGAALGRAAACRAADAHRPPQPRRLLQALSHRWIGRALGTWTMSMPNASRTVWHLFL